MTTAGTYAPAKKIQPKYVPAGGAAAAGPDTYVVYSKTGDADEVVVQTLSGEYVEHGSNHGRKFYKKTPKLGQEAVDVFIYFWDSRDGPAFEGWWFGNQLGGTQVWSHCSGGSMTPPSSGWKIPWDGAVRPSLAVELKKQAAGGPMVVAAPAGSAAGFPAAAAAAATGGGAMGREAGAIVQVGEAAKVALDEARASHQNYTSPEGIQAAEEQLQPHLAKLSEAIRKIMEAQRGAMGEAARQLVQMGSTIRAYQGQVNTELAKLRAAKAKAELLRKQKASDEKDETTLSEILPEAVQKTNLAEDAVEKAAITSEMIDASGEELDEVRQAVAQTEQAAQEAQKSIAEARVFLNAKKASVARFESDSVKAKAMAEIAKLLQQLQSAQNKLNPLKTVRQDFVQRTAAQKLVAETLERLSPAEVDVDRAEEATMLMSGEAASKDAMNQAMHAVEKASEHVTSVIKFITQKKATAIQGLPREELAKLEERAKAAMSRLSQLKGQHKEASEKVLCESLLKEAEEKIVTVGETIAKAADAEAPFLMGVEELPLEEALAAIKVCETVSTSANTAVSIARMFIATKLVEAKRFAPGPSKEASTKLNEYKGELEAHARRLTELKTNTATRKKAATMREADAEVAKAEALAKEVKAASELFADDARLFELSSEEIREASEKALENERAATEALATAKKFITARQIESKGKEMSTEVSAELIKYQTRLSAASAEVSKYSKLCGGVEQKLAAKRTLEEATKKVAIVEEKVAKVTEAAHAINAATSDESSGEAATEATKKATKIAEAAAAEAQVALRTSTRYFDSQNRTQGLSGEDVFKLRQRLTAAQQTLDETVSAIKERSEKVLVEALIKESEERVKEAEASIEKVHIAEEPFIRGIEEVPVEEAAKHISALETAAQGAHTATGGAKTFLAMKRLAAKRLSEASSKAATEELTAMQGRIDAVAKKLTEVKKGMAERKTATVKREAESRVATMEASVAEAVEATQALVSKATELAPEAMKAACEKAGTTQHQASTAVAETKSFLSSKQRDAKLLSSGDSSVSEAMTALSERLQKAQVELDKQKSALRDQEHRFVANRLFKDASEMVEKLEALLQSASEQAAPLTEDEASFAACSYLAHAVATLRLHMKSASKSTQELFKEIGEGASITEAKFVAFMEKLPEFTSSKELALSAEQLQACFRRMDSKGGGELTEDDFAEHFVRKWLINGAVSMTDTLAVKGSKTVRKLEINEVVEQMEEQTKDPALGMLRIKAKAEKDGKEGYITMSGNAGTVYLVEYDPITAVEKRVDQVLQELLETGGKTQKYVDTKIEELKSVNKGPLSETKSALSEMIPRIKKVQQERKRLRTTIADSKKKLHEAMESEKRRRQEAIDRTAADKILSDASTAVSEAESQAEKACSAAQALVASKGGDQEDPMKAFDEAEKELAAVTPTVDKALTMIKEHMEAVKNAVKGPFSEARATLVKHKVKVSSLETRCKKQLGALGSARKKASGEAQKNVTRVLAEHARSKGAKAEDLFKELSSDEKTVTTVALTKFIQAIPDNKLSPAQLELGVEGVAAGITKLTLMDMLQEYRKCVKEIAITTLFEVKDSKTVRKMQIGELVEILEHRQGDSSGLERARCRAIEDGAEGWLTVMGNQGTAFFDIAAKPYFCCWEDEVPLTSAFESSSSEVCKVRSGEVLEVLEGPRQEKGLEAERVKGTAAKDGKSGWVSLKDITGRVCLEKTKLLICRQSIAITTTFDIAEGKAIRKLDAGEALEIIEGPQEDPKRNLTRVKARTKRDAKEGWVTLKGNQGTAYAEESDTHYVSTVAQPLENRFASGSEALGQLEVGEVFEVSEGPTTEEKEGVQRVKGRNISDGTEGWFTLSGSAFKPWGPRYKCVTSTVINDGLAIKDGKAIRKLEAGEVVHALETPVFETAAGLLRIRVRAEKDGATGYATVRGNLGSVMLKPIAAGEGSDAAR